MAPFWLACCVTRHGDAEASAPRPAAPGPGRADLEDADLEFFDCIEPEESHAPVPPALATTLALPKLQVAPYSRHAVLDEPTPLNGRTDCLTACTDAASELVGELAEAARVLEETREEWSRRVIELGKDALAELQWADLSQAQRMLKANIGDAEKAVAMFLQALEFRTRNHELFVSLRCDVRCDMRILGSDVLEHSVVYMCARSQTEPLRCVRDQLVLTFEQACRLSQGEGRVYFILDMHGLRPQLYMDAAALNDLAGMFGTVFAERIFKIVIVDFSRAAQAAWWMVKQFLSPVTRDKLAFVGEEKALQLCQRDLDGGTFERLQKTFQVNRDPSRSPTDLREHARCMSAHEVPHGPPPPAGAQL